MRVLILGGTTDANQLVAAIAGDPRLDPILSYAGRTENPKRPPIAWRVGGFGGINGLIDYLRTEKIARVIDATHPFAAQMSAQRDRGLCRCLDSTVGAGARAVAASARRSLDRGR